MATQNNGRRPYWMKTAQDNAIHVKEIVRRTKAQLSRGDDIQRVTAYLVGAILHGGQKKKILDELAKVSQELVAKTLSALAEHDRLKAKKQVAYHREHGGT
ncbi:hypothetical protein D3C80_476090 [compost metagenome]